MLIVVVFYIRQYLAIFYYCVCEVASYMEEEGVKRLLPPVIPIHLPYITIVNSNEYPQIKNNEMSMLSESAIDLPPVL